MIFPSLVLLCRNIINSAVVVGLYYGFLTTFSIKPAYLFLMVEETEKKVAAITGLILGQLVRFISIYNTPLHLLLCRPHTITVLVLPYLLFSFFDNFRSATSTGSNFSIFLNSFIFQLVNHFIFPSSMLARLVNIYMFRCNNKMLFVTSSFVGWLIGHICFLLFTKRFFAWIRKYLLSRSKKDLVSKLNKYINKYLGAEFQVLFAQFLSRVSELKKYIKSELNKYINKIYECLVKLLGSEVKAIVANCQWLVSEFQYLVLIDLVRNSGRFVTIFLYVTCLYYLGRTPFPLWTFKMIEVPTMIEKDLEIQGQRAHTYDGEEAKQKEEGFNLYIPPRIWGADPDEDQDQEYHESFESVFAIPFFDSNRWNRPVRYIKNDRFAGAVRQEASQYFFDTCRSDGKERISFTYPPSFSIFKEMMKRRISSSTVEPLSFDKLDKAWLYKNKQKKKNLTNEFRKRIEALDAGLPFRNILEKRTRVCTDKTKKTCLPKMYDPFLNGPSRGRIKKLIHSCGRIEDETSQPSKSEEDAILESRRKLHNEIRESQSRKRKNNEIRKSRRRKNNATSKSRRRKNNEIRKSRRRKNNEIRKSRRRKNNEIRKSRRRKNNEIRKSRRRKNNEIRKSRRRKNNATSKSRRRKNNATSKSRGRINIGTSKSRGRKNNATSKSRGTINIGTLESKLNQILALNQIHDTLLPGFLLDSPKYEQRLLAILKRKTRQLRREGKLYSNPLEKLYSNPLEKGEGRIDWEQRKKKRVKQKRRYNLGIYLGQTEIFKKVPRWSYTLLTELEQDIEVYVESYRDASEIFSPPFKRKLRYSPENVENLTKKGTKKKDESTNEKGTTPDDEIEIVDIPSHLNLIDVEEDQLFMIDLSRDPDFDEGVIKGSMVAQRRKRGVIIRKIELGPKSPLFLGFLKSRLSIYFGFLNPKVLVLKIKNLMHGFGSKKSKKSKKGGLLTLNERNKEQTKTKSKIDEAKLTAERSDEGYNLEKDEVQWHATEEWDNVLYYGQGLRGCILLYNAYFRKYIALPSLIIAKNIVRLLLLQKPEWSEDIADWRKEVHVKCSYSGGSVSDKATAFPEEWFEYGLQIKVLCPFILKPWHTADDIDDESSDFAFIRTLWGLAEYPLGGARPDPSLSIFFTPIFKELEAIILKILNKTKFNKDDFLVIRKVFNKRIKPTFVLVLQGPKKIIKWLIKTVLVLKRKKEELFKKLKENPRLKFLGVYESSETKKEKDSIISNEIIPESFSQIQSTAWTNSEEKIKHLINRTSTIKNQIERITKEKKKVTPGLNNSTNNKNQNNNVESPKNIWKIVKRRNVRLRSKLHSFPKLFIEKIYKIYLDIFLCIINISRINLIKKIFDKDIYNTETNQKRITFSSTIKKINKRTSHILRKFFSLPDLSSLSQAYVFYKLSQTQVSDKLRSVLQYRGTSFFLKTAIKDSFERQGIFHSELKHKNLRNFGTNPWKNWLRGHYQYNLSQIRWSLLIPQKWRNGVNQRHTPQNKDFNKGDSYEKDPLLHYKKQNDSEVYSLTNQKNKFQKNYRYDLLAYKFIYSETKKDSYIYQFPLQVNKKQVNKNQEISYNYTTQQDKLFDIPEDIFIKNYLKNYIDLDTMEETRKRNDYNKKYKYYNRKYYRKYFDFDRAILKNFPVNFEAWMKIDPNHNTNTKKNNTNTKKNNTNTKKNNTNTKKNNTNTKKNNTNTKKNNTNTKKKNTNTKKKNTNTKKNNTNTKKKNTNTKIGTNNSQIIENRGLIYDMMCSYPKLNRYTELEEDPEINKDTELEEDPEINKDTEIKEINPLNHKKHKKSFFNWMGMNKGRFEFEKCRENYQEDWFFPDLKLLKETYKKKPWVRPIKLLFFNFKGKEIFSDEEEEEEEDVSKEKENVSKKKEIVSKEQKNVSKEKENVRKKKEIVSKGKQNVRKNKANVSKGKQNVSKEKEIVSKEQENVSKEKENVSKGKENVSKEKEDKEKEDKEKEDKEKEDVNKEKEDVLIEDIEEVITTHYENWFLKTENQYQSYPNKLGFFQYLSQCVAFQLEVHQELELFKHLRFYSMVNNIRRVSRHKEITLAYLRMGDVMMENLALLPGENFTFTEWVKRGIVIFKPQFNLSIKNHEQFLMYQAISISLVHKSKQQTNQRDGKQNLVHKSKQQTNQRDGKQNLVHKSKQQTNQRDGKQNLVHKSKQQTNQRDGKQNLVHKSKQQTNQRDGKQNLVHKSKQQTNQRDGKQNYVAKDNFDLLVPEMIFSSRRRREFRILNSFNFNLKNRNGVDINPVFCKENSIKSWGRLENSIKSWGQLLDESKYREKNELIKLKFFLWPNYRLEDLACMNRYWFDTNNGSRFSMLRIYMYPRLKIR
uniref:Protein TIC 214 n=1 Tax=Cyphia dentariifolia TaxID=2041117 RepID=A0A291F406_9ASTR|nr:hypothetical chloroplast RF1 [Cyphia dentariifolia]YP_009436583.1 hypothetical chloroplast RF1 [Cyphia dentariifolia]ATG26842.1 hypothetical chloroplast RF1 [Cyphia dentariifolia]ATG26859.1 hypothetical chloroplast RF1 [Cyphia dentariifolia]